MIKFSHFEKLDGTKVYSAKIIGYQLFGDDLEDAEFKAIINNGNIEVSSFNNVDFTGTNCDQEINDYIKNIPIRWENGYEFIDFLDLNDDSELTIIADKRSNMFNSINSTQNINNINNFKQNLK